MNFPVVQTTSAPDTSGIEGTIATVGTEPLSKPDHRRHEGSLWAPAEDPPLPGLKEFQPFWSLSL